MDYEVIRKQVESLATRRGKSSLYGPVGKRQDVDLFLQKCSCGNARVMTLEMYNNNEKKMEKGCHICRPRPSKNTPGHRRAIGYYCWKSMIDRCTRPLHKDFPRWGGRGVTICRRWVDGENEKTGFQCFIEDMGPRPSLMHSVDRCDGALIYSKDTCRWADSVEQASNRKNNIIVEFLGCRGTMSFLARRAGIPPRVAISRFKKYGWSVEEALTTPVRKRKKENPARSLTGHGGAQV